MGRDRGELALHAVQLPELGDGLLFAVEVLAQPCGRVFEQLVLLRQAVGQRSAPEVHLPSERERGDEHGDGP